MSTSAQDSARYPVGYAVAVAQSVEPRVVVPVVVGSSPIGHLSSPAARPGGCFRKRKAGAIFGSCGSPRDHPGARIVSRGNPVLTDASIKNRSATAEACQRRPVCPSARRRSPGDSNTAAAPASRSSASENPPVLTHTVSIPALPSFVSRRRLSRPCGASVSLLPSGTRHHEPPGGAPCSPDWRSSDRGIDSSVP